MQFAGNNKPPLGSVINWGHPLTIGLENCFLFNELAGNIVTDLVHMVPCKFAGAVSPVWNPKGVYFGSNADSYLDISKTRRVTQYGAKFSIEIIHYFENCINDLVFFSWDQSTSWKCVYHLNAAAPVWSTRTTTNATLSSSSTGTLLGWNHIVLVWDGAVKRTYRNGNPVAIDSPAHGAGIIYLSGCNNIWIGRAGDYQSEPSSVSLFRVWSRALSKTEIVDLYAKPYSMFNQRPYWMDYAEPPAGGISIPVFMHHYKMMRVNNG